MSDGQDYGWPDQYQQQGSGQQGSREPWPPQGQPWRPDQYDPGTHQRHLGQPQPPYPPQPYPPQGGPWPQPGYQPVAGTARWQAARLPPAAALRGAAGTALGPAARPAVPAAAPRALARTHKVASGFIAAGCIAVIAAAANAASTPSRPAANASTATTAAVAAPSASAAPDLTLSQAKAWGLPLTVRWSVPSPPTSGRSAPRGSSSPATSTPGVPRTPTCRPCRTRRPPSSPTRRLLRQAPRRRASPGCRPISRRLPGPTRQGQGTPRNAMNQYSAGNVDAASADIEAASTELGDGNVKLVCGYGGYQ